MFEMIVRNTPELVGADIEFHHMRGRGSVAGQFSVKPSGRIRLGIDARFRNMGTLLHELAHAVHFQRLGDFKVMATLVMTGRDHDAEWRGILLDLCARWAPGYGVLLAVSFDLQGLTAARR